MIVRIWLLTIFTFLALVSASFAQTTESIQIDTYYPAPYGIYNELTTTGNTYLAIQSGHNVGIGTTDPRARLHIEDDGLSNNAFRVDTVIGTLVTFSISDQGDIYWSKPEEGMPP